MAQQPPAKKAKADPISDLIQKIEAVDVSMISPAAILSDPEWSAEAIKPGRGLYKPSDAQPITKTPSQSPEPEGSGRICGRATRACRDIFGSAHRFVPLERQANNPSIDQIAVIFHHWSRDKSINLQVGVVWDKEIIESKNLL